MTEPEKAPVQEWTDQMLEEWRKTLPLIRARLNSDCPAHDAHDVHQNTWLAANARLRSYDASKPFGPWIRSVAISECKTFYRKTKGQKTHQGAYEQFAAMNLVEALAVIEEDIALSLVDEDGDYERLGHVLNILASILDNPAHLERTLKVVLAFDGNVLAASRALGLPVRTLQNNQDRTVRLAQVIHRALDRREMLGEAALTVGDLLACLPGEGLPEGLQVFASMIATGTELNADAIVALGEQLGVSQSASRDYYYQTVKMLAVAKLVLEQGLGVYRQYEMT